MLEKEMLIYHHREKILANENEDVRVIWQPR